jgi:ligand-binding sensor domain-containing protein
MFVEVSLPVGFGPDITAIEFDSRSNVWIGVKNGLVRIDALTGESEGFTTVNSGLLNDYVFNLTFNPHSGDMFVATKSGLSVVESTIGRPTTNLDSVYAFPNPFVINSSGDRLSFNFAEQAALRIYTVAGELVANLPQPIWDGRNDHGEPVASGVYLFVLTDTEGRSGRGKFLLVRNR